MQRLVTTFDRARLPVGLSYLVTPENTHTVWSCRQNDNDDNEFCASVPVILSPRTTARTTSGSVSAAHAELENRREDWITQSRKLSPHDSEGRQKIEEFVNKDNLWIVCPEYTYNIRINE